MPDADELVAALEAHLPASPEPTWVPRTAADVHPGDRVLLDSGAELTVTRVERSFLGRNDLLCLVDEDNPARWLAQGIGRPPSSRFSRPDAARRAEAEALRDEAALAARSARGLDGRGARGLRFGRWIARPSATSPASLIASESVGCGAIPSATVSTVDSASIATTPASIRSVTCGPTMTMPSSSPYRVSWIDFTQPTVSSCITARAFATHGNVPTATSSPYCSRACASVRPTPAISGIGVDRARHGAVVDDGVVAARVLGRDLALAEGRVRELPVAGAVADRVDVRDRSCGGARRWRCPCACRTRRRPPRARCPRRAARGRPRRASGRPRRSRPSPKRTVSALPVSSTLRALLAELRA